MAATLSSSSSLPRSTPEISAPIAPAMGRTSILFFAMACDRLVPVVAPAPADSKPLAPKHRCEGLPIPRLSGPGEMTTNAFCLAATFPLEGLGEKRGEGRPVPADLRYENGLQTPNSPRSGPNCGAPPV